MAVLRSLTACAVFAAACSFASAQRTWLVDWYGSGDFTDLPPAVAAASPGDTIVVANSDLNRYTTAVIDKGITLMQSYNYLILLDVTVDGLPAGQRFSLVGWGGSFNLRFSNCAGDVHLDRCDMFVPFTRVRNSCVFDNCANASINASGLYDVQVRNSRVIAGRSGMFGYQSFDGTVATPGLVMTDSEVSLSDCVVQGANQLASTPNAVPAPGIDMQGGNLTVTGRASFAAVQGGAACCDFSVNPPRSLTAAAVDSNGGNVVYDADVALAPVGGAPFAGSSNRQQREIGFLRQVTLPFPAAGFLETDLYAEPGVSGFVCAGAPIAPLPTPFGDLWLDPTSIVVVSSGTTDVDGRMRTVHPGLNASIPVGMVFGWQGVFLSPTTGLGFTLPAVTAMWTH